MASTKAECVISGMSGRFPAADSVAEFEYKLFNKIDMVTADDSRWRRGLFNLPHRNGKIKSMDKFDSDYFNIPGNSAEFIDPQDRIFLELVVEAAADAGKSRMQCAVCAAEHELTSVDALLQDCKQTPWQATGLASTGERASSKCTATTRIPSACLPCAGRPPFMSLITLTSAVPSCTRTRHATAA